MSRVLVVTNDTVGERMAGPAIRAWEFARALSRNHAVTLAAPAPLPSQAPFPLLQASRRQLRSAMPLFDVAVAQGTGLHEFPMLRQAPFLVIDIYDPFVLENLELHADQDPQTRQLIHASDLGVVRQQLIAGDFFLCASERQRHFWIGMLSAVNRINPLTYDADPTLRRLIDVVPFGLDENPAQKTGAGLRDGSAIRSDDIVVLWGGGVWNWFDPLTLLRGMSKAVGQRPDLKLVFMGTTHPNPSIPKMRMLVNAHRLADDLGLTGKHVFFRPGWVPYQQRHNFLADADIGVSLHFDHVETVYSFRTRVLDYLWAGLPMILTAGDEMADLAAAEGFGVVVNYEDPDGVAAALLRLAADSELRRSYGQRALEVSRRFRWGVVVEPLNRYCAAPCPSPDSVIRKQLTRREKRFGATPLSVLARKALSTLRSQGPTALARRVETYVRRRI